MQMTEDLIRSVVQQVLSQMGGGPATQRHGPRGPSGDARRLPLGRRRRRRRRGRVRRVPHRPLADRKKAVDCIKTICVEHAEELGQMELDETKIGRLDHKIAKLRTIPHVPGVEFLRTENARATTGSRSPIRPVRRDRRDHARHAQPADALRQRDQHARGGQHGRLQRPPVGPKIAAEGVRRFNKAIREAIGIDDLITIIVPPTLESAEALFDHRGIQLLVVTGGPAVARAALGSKRRAIVAGPGNPPVVVDETACLETPRSRSSRRGVRQQPALHRREAGLRRRRHLRQADGGRRPARRLRAQPRPDRGADAGRVHQGGRRQAARQQGPGRPGRGGPGEVAGVECRRARKSCSARRTRTICSSSTSR